MHEYRFSIVNLKCEACSKVCAIILRKIPDVVAAAVAADGAAHVVTDRPVDTVAFIRELGAEGYEAVT